MPVPSAVQPQLVLGFLLVVMIIAVTPGPAMALILRRAAVRGPRAAVPTVLGLELGLYLWALAAGAGVAALVAASELAHTILRVVGAAVLLWLGLRAWRSGWRLRGPGGTEASEATVPRGRVAFGEGLLVQLANPKAAVFLFAFYPQFIPHGAAVLPWTAAWALLQVGVETLLYLALAAAVGRARLWFRRRSVRRRLDYLSGSVLIALGARVAADPR